MKTKTFNPFIITGYESPEYFCDRERETRELLDALENGRNVTLTSPRRMGKTGLILHAFHILKERKPKAVTIYMDLFSTESLEDFTRMFASEVLGSLDSNPMKILKQATAILKGIRPNITIDGITGKAKVGIDIEQGEEEHTLSQVFDYLKQSSKDCYIAFDEFQQIAQYPEKNVEALLRSYIQNIHNVHFIFSGSQSHLLSEMFLSPKRPFYQSTANKTIGAIDCDPYFNFASKFFSVQGRILPFEVFEAVYRQYDGHTWYIQKIMNQLYGGPYANIDDAAVIEATGQILRENDYYYQMLLRSYTKGQAKLLKAVAAEGLVKEITSGSFISKYGLTATSSVKSASNRLIENELLYRSPEGYMIYDRFFGLWLRSLSKE
ncbi:MAG: ATP-binding protein [Bacteroidales bacterium]|nr:ATP-binding protein [Bacteroidales bacterium]